VFVPGSVTLHFYLFGPHFVYRRSRYATFAETLFGIHNPHLAKGPAEWTLCQPPLRERIAAKNLDSLRVSGRRLDLQTHGEEQQTGKT
jgi:hypothetical protein